MKIRDKEYMEVKDRVALFRSSETFSDWSIVTEILENNEETGSIIFKASIFDFDQIVRGTGHAHEFKGDKTSMVNATSHLENCETSAIGRALASLGIGVDSSYASFDEVEVALNKAERKTSTNSGDRDAPVRAGDPVKEGKIRQSTDNPIVDESDDGETRSPSVNAVQTWEEVMWKGKKKHKGKTLGFIIKKDPAYLVNTLKEHYETMAKEPEFLKAIEAAVASVQDDGKQDFPNAK